MWRTRAATALAAAGALIMSGGLVMLASPAATAGGHEGSYGNNGTVKVGDTGDLDGPPENNPHLPCTFNVQWFNFDSGWGPLQATVVFEDQSPTGVLKSVTGNTSPSFTGNGGQPGAGDGLDHAEQYTLAFDGPPQDQQGYHVKVTVTTPHSQGNDTKSKVFWVGPCGDVSTDVSPVTPIVTPSRCVAGQPTKATLNLPADTDEIDYEYGAGNTTVVATLKDSSANEWGALPPGWSLNGSTATYTPPAGSLDDAKCGETKTDVSPVSPSVTPSRCVGTNPTAAVINKPGDGNFVTYSLNGTTVTATLTDTVNHQWGSMPTGWVQVDADTATYTVPASALAAADCTPPPPPPTDVCPNIPGLQASVPAGYQLIDGDCVEILGVEEITPVVGFTDPTCEKLSRAKWSGNMNDLVDYTVTGTPGRGNSITVTANIKPAVADEFAFPAGFDNTFDHSYPSKADLNCPTVKGSESVKPKPHKTRTPTVLGTQAVAPTAVDAGLASLPSSSGPSTTSLLAQLMVAGGLLLLLAGGWLGLGRREDGRHQA
jgi:hypothetical protein